MKLNLSNNNSFYFGKKISVLSYEMQAKTYMGIC